MCFPHCKTKVPLVLLSVHLRAYTLHRDSSSLCTDIYRKAMLRTGRHLCKESFIFLCSVYLDSVKGEGESTGVVVSGTKGCFEVANIEAKHANIEAKQ